MRACPKSGVCTLVDVIGNHRYKRLWYECQWLLPVQPCLSYLLFVKFCLVLYLGRQLSQSKSFHILMSERCFNGLYGMGNYHILRLNNIWFLLYDNNIKLTKTLHFSNWCLAGWYEKFITCFDCYHMPFRNVITWHSGDARQIPEYTPQCYVFSEKHYKVVYKTII